MPRPRKLYAVSELMPAMTLRTASMMRMEPRLGIRWRRMVLKGETPMYLAART